MKRILLVAAVLTVCLLTNLSFRVPTAVEAQQACVTGNAPTFVQGVNPADLFYLGTQLQFTSSTTGASFFTFTPGNTSTFGVFPGFDGTTGLGFAATGQRARYLRAL